MLFAIAGIGALLNRKGILGDPVVKGISDVVTLVTNPALLIMVTQHEYTPDTRASFLSVLWISTLVMAVTTAAVYAAFRREDEKRRPIIALLAAFPNAGFMGLPIIQKVYGDLGALYLAAFIVGSTW
jgi:predicted permease